MKARLLAFLVCISVHALAAVGNDPANVAGTLKMTVEKADGSGQTTRTLILKQKNNDIEGVVRDEDARMGVKLA